MTDAGLAHAATVVVLRDGPGGAEVLLLERPHDRGSYAAAWVFPGGAVDPEDAPDAEPGTDPDATAEATARRAAARETAEETSLVVAPDALVPLARWHPPAEAPKRLITWFFGVVAPAGSVVLNPHEAVAHAWITPAAALERHAAGQLLLYPPTWMTLNALGRPARAVDALEAARSAGRAEFATRFGPGRTVVLWEGDAAYEDDALLDAAGARHRLVISGLPWTFERTDPDA